MERGLTNIVQGIEDSEDIQAILDSLLGEVVDGIIAEYRICLLVCVVMCRTAATYG